MAAWDDTTSRMIYFPDEPVEGRPGWVRRDCGCCNGLEWGGEEPRECRDCGGDGCVFVHLKSGVIAEYPGGPLRGSCGRESIVKEGRP